MTDTTILHQFSLDELFEEVAHRYSISLLVVATGKSDKPSVRSKGTTAEIVGLAESAKAASQQDFDSLHFRFDVAWAEEKTKNTIKLLRALVQAGQIAQTEGVAGQIVVPCRLDAGEHQKTGEPILEVVIPVRSTEESLAIGRALQVKRKP